MKPGEMNNDSVRSSSRSSYSNADRQPAWKKKEFQKPMESESIKVDKGKDNERSQERDDRDRRKEREKRRRRSLSSSSSSGLY